MFGWPDVQAMGGGGGVNLDIWSGKGRGGQQIYFMWLATTGFVLLTLRLSLISILADTDLNL